MTSLRRQPHVGFSELAITGVGGRLPGANDETEFWHLLDQGWIPPARRHW
jgi:acyl transferase domain-containing protein